MSNGDNSAPVFTRISSSDFDLKDESMIATPSYVPPGRRQIGTPAAAEKTEWILKAAERLFSIYGYENTTIDQIVQSLGVTKPFLYYYFNGKQEIFETLTWRPLVECMSAMDFPADDPRPAHEKIKVGIERLIQTTIKYYPSSFFPARDPQAFGPEYRAEHKRLTNHFYSQMCILLEEGREEGWLDFNETHITALAACSLPGFLYQWYRPEGRLNPEQITQELTTLALRVLGLRRTRRIQKI